MLSGKAADLGIAGGNNSFIIFKKGNIIKTVNQSEALEALFEEINKF